LLFDGYLTNKNKAMGVFSTILIDIRCPFCNEISEMESQTQELDEDFEVFREGDFLNTELKELDCVTSCTNTKCKKETIKKHGYWDGFGRIFDVKIILNDNKITGEYKFKIDKK